MKERKKFVWALCSILITAGILSSCTTTSSLERDYDSFESLDAFFSEHNIPKVSSSHPEYYFTGAEWNERSLEVIEKAEDYILITVFSGNYHELTLPVWNLLAEKMEEGVRVYCIIDSASHFVVSPDDIDVLPAAFHYLKELGIPTVEYNQISLSNLFFLPRLLDRDHRKHWIIDGKYLSMGGININYTSLGYPPGLGNIDTMTEVISPEAADILVESFVETWNAHSPDKLSADEFSIPAPEDIEADTEETSFWLIDHYWPTRSQVSALFDAFFLSAEKELWLIQGFTYLTPGILNRVRFAADRGVEVNIMLSTNHSGFYYEPPAFYGILDLLDAGANVYIHESPHGAFLHYKLFLADRRTAALGSVNYNLRSQTYSREISYVFDDPVVGSELMENLETLLEHSRKVTREEAKEYRTLPNFLMLLLMQFWG